MLFTKVMFKAISPKVHPYLYLTTFLRMLNDDAFYRHIFMILAIFFVFLLIKCVNARLDNELVLESVRKVIIFVGL